MLKKEGIMVELEIKNSSEKLKIDPSKIIALGLNYLDHIKESVSQKTAGETKIPEEPVLFNKTPNVLIGNHEDIVIPQFLERYNFAKPRVDYEAELAIIIGKKAKNIAESEASDYIFGYTCMNDVSQRNLQTGDQSGWFRGKSLDTFGPIGPVIIKAEDIGDPHNLEIKCRLNGETVQASNTSRMIFQIPEIISFVSYNFTLEKGDIIMTGTPAGVGAISHGDVVEVEIENIGILKNTVIEE
jgi:2-keto-4-pentenoate hydratase/2-oxohepta-3-ene-1,7-dioic acid hydratase in catechol pathway